MGELSGKFKYGYWLRLARINLTDLKVSTEPIPAEVVKKYLGGKGFAAYYLCTELKRNIDPLGAENKIVIAAGPFQGTAVQSAGKFVVASKSPLTNLFLDSYASGRFGHMLKKCGFDAVIIEGSSEKPVYISIVDSCIEFHHTPNIWGKTTTKVEKTLHKLYGEKAVVLSAGIAGENKVRFACLISDSRRAAGRGGLGAVFGSKKLKAVVVRGNTAVGVASPSKIKTLNRLHSLKIAERRRAGDLFYKYGTSQAVELAHNLSRLPTHNFQNGQFVYSHKIGGDALHKRYEVVQRACSSCAIKCAGWLVEKEMPRPEYETLAMLGANCGIKKISTILRANVLCNEYGLDTISTGSVIAFAMECSEKKLLTADLKFGDDKKLLGLIKDIAFCRGLGAEISAGTRNLSAKIGGQQFAMNVKGLEVPAWDPRGKLGGGLAYMTADIGASHLRDSYTVKKIPNIPVQSALPIVGDLIKSQNRLAVIDSYIFCIFALLTATEQFVRELYEAVTGVAITAEQEQEIGERIWNLIRLFNIREGISQKDDKLPARFLEEPIKSGVAKGCCAFISEDDERQALQKYYRVRGWDQNGLPLKSTLKRLGLLEYPY